MTVEELKEYYADLLIVQYRDKPKAYDTIKACVEMAIMDKLPIAVQDCFNVDEARGVQLDTLAKYQGITRYSWGPNGDFELSDEDFRSLIKMAIVKNSSDSSLATIQFLLNKYFPGEIQAFDTRNMKIHYLIDIGTSNLIYAFINGGLLPKPMGVQNVATLYVDDITKVFGFRTYNNEGHSVVPLNNYEDYDEDTQFLQHSDNIQEN